MRGFAFKLVACSDSRCRLVRINKKQSLIATNNAVFLLDLRYVKLVITMLYAELYGIVYEKAPRNKNSKWKLPKVSKE